MKIQSMNLNACKSEVQETYKNVSANVIRLKHKAIQNLQMIDSNLFIETVIQPKVLCSAAALTTAFAGMAYWIRGKDSSQNPSNEDPIHYFEDKQNKSIAQKPLPLTDSAEFPFSTETVVIGLVGLVIIAVAGYFACCRNKAVDPRPRLLVTRSFQGAVFNRTENNPSDLGVTDAVSIFDLKVRFAERSESLSQDQMKGRLETLKTMLQNAEKSWQYTQENTNIDFKHIINQLTRDKVEISRQIEELLKSHQQIISEFFDVLEINCLKLLSLLNCANRSQFADYSYEAWLLHDLMNVIETYQTALRSSSNNEGKLSEHKSKKKDSELLLNQTTLRHTLTRHNNSSPSGCLEIASEEPFSDGELVSKLDFMRFKRMKIEDINAQTYAVREIEISILKGILEEYHRKAVEFEDSDKSQIALCNISKADYKVLNALFSDESLFLQEINEDGFNLIKDAILKLNLGFHHTTKKYRIINNDDQEMIDGLDVYEECLNKMIKTKYPDGLPNTNQHPPYISTILSPEGTPYPFTDSSSQSAQISCEIQ